MELIGLILVWIGVAFCGIGVLGIARFDNVYNRLHAAGLVQTLGVGALALGGAFLMPSSALKLILLGIFLVVTGPSATQAIAMAARCTPKTTRTAPADRDGEAASQAIDPTA